METVKHTLEAVFAPLKRNPLVARTLVLMFALVAYSAGLLAVDAVLDNRLALALVAVFFLPAVLRAWMEVYWAARDILRERLKHHHRAF